MTVVKVKTEIPKTRFVRIPEHKPGDVLVTGEFLETKEVDNFNKDGKVSLHLFRTDNNETVGLNGTRQLDTLLGFHKPGDFLEVVFLGKEPGVSKEGKKFKRNLFEVHAYIEE